MPIRMALSETTFTPRITLVEGKVVLEGEFQLGEQVFSVAGTMGEWKKRVFDGIRQAASEVAENPKMLGLDLEAEKAKLSAQRLLREGIA